MKQKEMKGIKNERNKWKLKGMERNIRTQEEMIGNKKK